MAQDKFTLTVDEYKALLARIEALEKRSTSYEEVGKNILTEIRDGRLAQVCKLVLGNAPKT